MIQDYATDIVKKLTMAGYTAYFAGGWVRDYLMGHPSDDIDIATDAPPEKILDLFPHTILVGLAFGVIIVVVDGHQFEVATFRKDVDYVNGRTPTQIELSSAEEDASRRDFTVNGMFFDPLSEEILDFVHGKEDLKKKLIRTIGNPYERFVEDRLRMIRAVRFASRFEFIIDEDTKEAILANADTLFPAVAMERVWNEFAKMSKYPHFDKALVEMHTLSLLGVIFPELAETHLNDIRARVNGFSHYLKGTGTILFLMALFPQASEENAEDLCEYLHTSRADAHLARYYVGLKRKALKDQNVEAYDKVDWAHLYAHPQSLCCLNVIASHLHDKERKDFLDCHLRRMKELKIHINRIAQKKPLVNAAFLQANGIKPGKLMGDLIKAGERVVIEQNKESPGEVIEILKISSLWPSEKGNL